MKHEGPYRGEIPTEEMEDPKIAEMKKQIEAEGKHGVLIKKEWQRGQEVPEFAELLKKKIDPKKIVFYSPVSGIYENVPDNYYVYAEDGNIYTYSNNEDSRLIVIKMGHKSFKKVAIILKVMTADRYNLERGENKLQK